MKRLLRTQQPLFFAISFMSGIHNSGDNLYLQTEIKTTSYHEKPR